MWYWSLFNRSWNLSCLNYFPLVSFPFYNKKNLKTDKFRFLDFKKRLIFIVHAVFFLFYISILVQYFLSNLQILWRCQFNGRTKSLTQACLKMHFERTNTGIKLCSFRVRVSTWKNLKPTQIFPAKRPEI